MMFEENVLSKARSIEGEIIQIRRHLHQNPELSNYEYNTSDFIQKKLTEYDIYFESGFAKTGVLGIIKGAKPGKTVALRADIDALPIQEQNTHPFVSKVPNVMHACGHDAHTAMLLGAGYIFKEMEKQLAGTILLVFQPAEEDAPLGGANKMMNDGVFEKYNPDVIFGQHVWPDLPAGEIGIRDNEMMGGTDRFKVTLEGKGGHASMPHKTNDVIVASGHLIVSLQTIVSRNLDPTEASVVTIGKVNGGNTPNVIPDTVTMEGSIRSYSFEIKKSIKEQFLKIAEHVAETFGVEAKIDYIDGYPATINNSKWAKVARNSAHKLLGETSTPDVKPSMAAEDFSRFLNKYPGAFIWLGSQNKEQNVQTSLHDNKFMIDEESLKIGCALFVQLAFDSLKELNKDSGNNLRRYK